MLTTSPIITSTSASTASTPNNVSRHSFPFVPARSPPTAPIARSSSTHSSRERPAPPHPSRRETVPPTAGTDTDANPMASSNNPTEEQRRAPDRNRTSDSPTETASPSSPDRIPAPAETQRIVVPQLSDPPKTAPEAPSAQDSRRPRATPVAPHAPKRSAEGPEGPSPSTGDDKAQRPDSSESQDPARPSQRPRPSPPSPKVLPLAYEHCVVGDMVVLIAHMLSELIETNDALALSSGSLTRFHSRTAPGISVLDYLNRLAHHATLTPPLLLSMVYYIDRLCALYPEFTINTLTVHRFLITAATVAAKGLSDSFWNNATYAKVGGLRVAELKMLELEFLYRVDWRIVPNPDVLVAYYKGLVERCPGFVLEQLSQGSSGDEDTNSLESGHTSPSTGPTDMSRDADSH